MRADAAAPISASHHTSSAWSVVAKFRDIKRQIELKPLKDEEKFPTIVEDRIQELAALDRYERRALSKRKSAICAFDAAGISRSKRGPDPR